MRAGTGGGKSGREGRGRRSTASHLLCQRHSPPASGGWSSTRSAIIRAVASPRTAARSHRSCAAPAAPLSPGDGMEGSAGGGGGLGAGRRAGRKHRRRSGGTPPRSRRNFGGRRPLKPATPLHAATNQPVGMERKKTAGVLWHRFLMGGGGIPRCWGDTPHPMI